MIMVMVRLFSCIVLVLAAGIAGAVAQGRVPEEGNLMARGTGIVIAQLTYCNLPTRNEEIVFEMFLNDYGPYEKAYLRQVMMASRIYSADLFRSSRVDCREAKRHLDMVSKIIRDHIAQW
jgi:hypothetical protein